MIFFIIMVTITAAGLGIIAFLLIREKKAADRSLRLSIPEPAPQPAPSIPEPQENAISENEKHRIEKEVHLSFELDELKQKYEKLERMLTEKNTELEQTKQFLDSELKAKKEFNKIKDILEKEIKENKDKGLALKSQLNIVKTENENANRRIEQFEEKILSLERELLAKQQENERIKGELKTPQPQTDLPAVPPISEEKSV